MENFDAVGRWRDTDAGMPMDGSGSLNGVAFNGMSGLRKVLLARPEEFVGTFTEKLLMYALGRNVQYYDQPVVRAIIRQARADNYAVASLVLGVARSIPFQMRRAADGPGKPQPGPMAANKAPRKENAR